MTTNESDRDQPLSTTSVDQDGAIKDQPLRQRVSVRDVKAKSVQEVGDWSDRSVEERNLVEDIGVSYDMGWQKRGKGHNSLTGCFISSTRC